MVLQELNAGNWLDYRKVCGNILKDSVLLCSNDHHHLNGYASKQNFRYWKDRCIISELQYGQP